MFTLARSGVLFSALIVSASVIAQDLGPRYAELNWTLEEYQTRCIPIWSEEMLEIAVVDGGCTVAEFGEIAQIDGFSIYYALYNDDKRFLPEYLEADDDRDVWIQNLRASENWVTESTALVLFQIGPGTQDRPTIFHLRKQERPSGFTQVETFSIPEIIQTDIGPVMYLRGFGCCDGMQQYVFDEYLLWRDHEWLKLDPHAWFQNSHDPLRLPAGYSLNGIGNLFFQSLKKLIYDASVWGPDDPNCCPSGGDARIHFEWDDLTLRISSFDLVLN